MRVGLDLFSEEEEFFFDMEDVEWWVFDKDRDLFLWKWFLIIVKKFGEDWNSLKFILCYCGVFMVFGMLDEILGLILLEFKCLIGKFIIIMSVLFFVYDLCNVFGLILGGYLVDW